MAGDAKDKGGRRREERVYRAGSGGRELEGWREISVEG